MLGVPDPYSGEVPVALVVLGDEAKERVARGDGEARDITISILKASSVTTRHMRVIWEVDSPGLAWLSLFSSWRTTSRATSGLAGASTSRDRSRSLPMER